MLYKCSLMDQIFPRLVPLYTTPVQVALVAALIFTAVGSAYRSSVLRLGVVPHMASWLSTVGQRGKCLLCRRCPELPFHLLNPWTRLTSEVGH